MTFRVEIDRLQVNVQGISTLLIEEAVQGLDAELGRRLGVNNLGQSFGNNTGMVDLAELAIGPINVSSTLDAGELRGLIAERLLGAIEIQANSAAEGEI